MIHRLLRAGAVIRFDPTMQVRHARHAPAVRRASRSTYGFGMGAFCARWIRRGDTYAAVIWARWLLDRVRVAASGAVHRRWRDVDEQIRSLRGGAAGFVHGLTRDGR